MTEPTDRIRVLLRHTADHLPGGPVTVPGPGVFRAVATVRRRRRLVLAGVFALVLVAVTVPAVTLRGREPRLLPPLVPPPTSAPTPVDCGNFNLGKGENLPDAAIQCFVRALDERRSARLTVTILTTEGDPIPHTYRANPDGRVEVIVDTTQDQFGPRGITRQICTGPTPGTPFLFDHCADIN